MPIKQMPAKENIDSILFNQKIKPVRHIKNQPTKAKISLIQNVLFYCNGNLEMKYIFYRC